MAPSAPEPRRPAGGAAVAAAADTAAPATPPRPSRCATGPRRGRRPGPTARRGRVPPWARSSTRRSPRTPTSPASRGRELPARRARRRPRGAGARRRRPSRCCRPSPAGDAQWPPCLRTTRPCASPAPTAPTPRVHRGPPGRSRRRPAPAGADRIRWGSIVVDPRGRGGPPRRPGLRVCRDAGCDARARPRARLGVAAAHRLVDADGDDRRARRRRRGHRAERPARGPAVGACRRGVRHRPRVRRSARPAHGPRGPRPHAALVVRRARRHRLGHDGGRRRRHPPGPGRRRRGHGRGRALPSSRTCSRGSGSRRPSLGFVALAAAVLAAVVAASRFAEVGTLEALGIGAAVGTVSWSFRRVLALQPAVLTVRGQVSAGVGSVLVVGAVVHLFSVLT